MRGNISRVIDPQRRAEINQQREAAILRREKLLERARAILNRAQIEGGVSRDRLNVTYVMRPDTARFLLDHRPEIFWHSQRRCSPREK